LHNKVLSAYDGDEGYKLILKNKDEIFLIISDMNMPRVNGLELKRLIEDTPELKLRAIPFIFHTSVAESLVVKEAYALNIQGYMAKQMDIKKTISLLEKFVGFWSETMHPSYFMVSTKL
jgi:CheY-like chemotaxis protein